MIHFVWLFGRYLHWSITIAESRTYLTYMENAQVVFSETQTAAQKGGKKGAKILRMPCEHAASAADLHRRGHFTKGLPAGVQAFKLHMLQETLKRQADNETC